MAVFSGAFSTPGTSASITLQLVVNQVSQSIANNTSTVSWVLQAVKGSAGYPSSYAGRGSSNAYVNGWVYSNSGMNYNFPSGAYTWVIASGSTVVAHNADGTKAIWCEASYNAGGEEIGNASCSGSMTLTTIPRATQPTVSPAAGDTGSAFTIGHAPATSSFYHDISYSINGGTTFTPIETGIPGTDTSTTWTPPHSLLPNESTKTAIIRCVTRASSGGTVIGTKDVNVNLTVPSSVKPVVSTVDFEEAQLSSPNMVTLMGGPGRYVRRWSKLKPTVTSSGAGGSSLVSSSVTLAGQTTPSGVAFAEPINASGSPSYAATAVDTRGRSSDVYYNTVAVKAYDYPNLPVPTITRTSDAAGLNPSPTGTYLRVTPNASTSKLDFGDGEKNLLEWQIRTRPKGGSWTVAQVWTTATVSGNTIWTTPKVLAGYAANTEFEVEVSIRDLFGKNGFDAANTVKTLTMNVPSEAVFMDWNEEVGIGLGRYHSGSGARLQVADGIDVATGGLSVAGVSILTSNTTTKGIVELATNAETQAGTDAERVVTPASLKSLTATESRAGLAEIATQAEVDAGTDDARYISPLKLKSWSDAGSHVGMKRIIPASVAISGGAVAVDTDGTVEVTTSGVKALSLNGIFEIGKSYKVAYLFNSSGAENVAYRMRTGGSDYTVAGYVMQGVYVSGGWPGSIAGVSGYGSVGTSGLLSVNGQVIAYGELDIHIAKTGVAYIVMQGVSRSGQTSTQWRHTCDVTSGLGTDGLTFLVNLPVLNVGSFVKVWEMA